MLVFMNVSFIVFIIILKTELFHEQKHTDELYLFKAFSNLSRRY